MVQGLFAGNIPFIQIALGWGQAVQTPVFILDTGFSGDLQVTPEIAQQLGLTVSGVTPAKIADGSVIQTPTALAIAAMEGAASLVQVLIAQSPPLAGISLLTKFHYKAIVDCKHRTVQLERVA